MLGDPILRYYIIEINLSHMFTTDDTMINIVGLFPNVYYNVTIRSSSSYFVNGGNGDWVNFTTLYEGTYLSISYI